MSKLITPINIGPYGGAEDWRCCQIEGDSFVTDISIASATNLATRTKHGFGSGHEVILISKSGGSGLTVTDHYFVYAVDTNSFKLCATYADAWAGIPVAVGTDATSVVLQRLSPPYPPLHMTTPRWEWSNSAFDIDYTAARTLYVQLNTAQLAAGSEFNTTARFGICCEYELSIDIVGYMRILNGRDSCEMLLNGVQVFFKDSDATEGEAWWRANRGAFPPSFDPLYEHNTYRYEGSISPVMDQLTCGDILEVICRSEGVHPTDQEGLIDQPIGWFLTITN